MADDGVCLVKYYIWVDVNVEGVLVIVKIYIIGLGNLYELFLFKRWLYRVKVIEDYESKIL